MNPASSMNLRRSTTILIGLLACILLAFMGVRAESQTSKFTSAQQQILKSIAPAKIIYLGEIHNSTTDHADQLAILEYLYQQKSKAKPPLAIGLEMFQKPYQPIINQYLAGKISEEQLVEQTEYKKRWGWPWENYAPLLRFAKAHQLPVIALNTPTEVLRKVAKGGLESLQPTDFQYIPPATEIDKSNLTYRDLILGSYKQHKVQAVATSPDFDRFYTAQLLWDETMAATASEFYQQRPQTQLVVIAGQAHIRYGYGIPDRVARRLGKNMLKKSVILSSDETSNEIQETLIANFLFRPIQKKEPPLPN
jgi:uncharacterized iron-regulated protein